MIDLVSMLKKALTPDMMSFYGYFPEAEAKEMRTAIVRRHPSLPVGEYTFLELYCRRVGCDCRNVILSVSDQTGRTLATINHALDPDGFQDIGEPRSYLDPLNAQSEHAPSLLELFKNSVLDANYAERLERHWRMVKERVHGGTFPARPKTTECSRPEGDMRQDERMAAELADDCGRRGFRSGAR